MPTNPNADTFPYFYTGASDGTAGTFGLGGNGRSWIDI